MKIKIILFVTALVIIGGFAITTYRTPDADVVNSTIEPMTATSTDMATSSVVVDEPTPKTNTPTIPTPTNSAPTEPTTPDSGTQSTGITQSQVAQHNDASSCWTIVDGKVYDLTDWINKHPGGKSAILRLCGVDGTTAFARAHGSSRKAQSALVAFFIGDLSN